MTFGEKLKQLRVRNEYSQENLAELLNVSRQAITKWESGNGMPDIENLKAIADVFDVTLDSLVRDEEEIESTEEDFCWKFAGVGFAIGFVIQFLIRDFGLADTAFLGIGGGIIGYAIGYLIVLIKK